MTFPKEAFARIEDLHRFRLKRKGWEVGLLKRGDNTDSDSDSELNPGETLLNQLKTNTKAYDSLFTAIKQHLFDPPEDVIVDAAMKVLLVLNDDKLNNNPDKKKEEIEKLLDVVIPKDTFSQLLLIADVAAGAAPASTTVEAETSVYKRYKVQDHNTDAGNGDMEKGQRVGKQHKLLDFDRLKFRDLDTAKRKITLGVGSRMIGGRGYHEMFVPPMEQKMIDPAEELKRIIDMPDWVQPAFVGMSQLDKIPSRIFEAALHGDGNILFCAPARAGERDVAILSILQQIAPKINLDRPPEIGACIIGYIAPVEARVEEVVRNLSDRLQHYSVPVKELSSVHLWFCQKIHGMQVFVTTPEQWDALSRSENQAFMKLVKLLIIDQIHLLHDPRGAVLEAFLARTVRKRDSSKEKMRLVGLSAPLPDCEDIATFIRVDGQKGLFYLDNSKRPYPLVQRHVAMSPRSPLGGFKKMNHLCYQKAIAMSEEHQILIFVHSATETARTARKIRDTALANN